MDNNKVEIIEVKPKVSLMPYVIIAGVLVLAFYIIIGLKHGEYI